MKQRPVTVRHSAISLGGRGVLIEQMPWSLLAWHFHGTTSGLAGRKQPWTVVGAEHDDEFCP